MKFSILVLSNLLILSTFLNIALAESNSCSFISEERMQVLNPSPNYMEVVLDGKILAEGKVEAGPIRKVNGIIFYGPGFSYDEEYKLVRLFLMDKCFYIKS